MWLRRSTSTRSISPTKPTSTPPPESVLWTRKSWPSSPQMPTADCPWRFSDRTMSLFCLPTSTIFATSTVSASDTRRPSSNFTSIPSRSISRVIIGPPPCTTIGCKPTYRSSTMSWAKSCVRPASVIAAPPILITTVFPWNSRMYGSASRSVPTSRIRRPPDDPKTEQAKDAGSKACAGKSRPEDAAMRRFAGSCRVLRVDGHVVVREVGEEDLRLAALAGDGQRELNLVALHRLLEGAELVLGERDCLPRAHHGLPFDLQVHEKRPVHHLAGRLEDAAVVGIRAVERRL